MRTENSSIRNSGYGLTGTAGSRLPNIDSVDGSAVPRQVHFPFFGGKAILSGPGPEGGKGRGSALPEAGRAAGRRAVLTFGGGSGCAAGRGKAGHAAAVRSRIKKAACRVRGRPWSPPVAGGPAPRGVGAGGGSFKRGDYCFCTVMERAAGASGCLRGMTMVSTPFLWLALMFSTSASSARPIWRQKEP